jgi:Arc-like DNA binding domain
VARKPTDQVQLKFRVPERLRATIEKRAKKSGRSLSGEIVAMLETAARVGSFDRLEEATQAIAKSSEEYREGVQSILQWIEEQRRFRAAMTPEEKATVSSLTGAIMDRMAKSEESSRDADDEGDNK